MNFGPSSRAWGLAALAGVIAVSTAATAAPSTRTRESYQTIVDRNPFGLKPPPPPVDPEATKPPPPPAPKTDIKLTGITTIGYPKLPKKAYFQTTEQNKKEPSFYALSEGQSKDNIEVLLIDEKRPATVKIKMAGLEQTLTFESHGIKPPASAPPQGIPGAPGLPGLPGAMQPGGGAPGQPPGFPQPAAHPQPVGQPVGQQNGQPNMDSRTIPARPLRAGFDSPTINAGQQQVQAQQQEQQAQNQNLDPAQQIIGMKAQELYNKRRNIPYPPTPPIQ